MALWVTFYDGPNDQVEVACEKAAAVLKAAGFSPAEAQDAAMEAADLSNEHDGPTPNADKVVAWYNAEFAAMEHLQEADGGTWPNGAALIYVDQGE